MSLGREAEYGWPVDLLIFASLDCDPNFTPWLSFLYPFPTVLHVSMTTRTSPSELPRRRIRNQQSYRILIFSDRRKLSTWGSRRRHEPYQLSQLGMRHNSVVREQYVTSSDLNQLCFFNRMLSWRGKTLGEPHTHVTSLDEGRAETGHW